MQRLQGLAQFGGGVGVQQRVNLHDDVQIVSASLAAGGDALHGPLQVVLAIAAADLRALAAPNLGQRGIGIGGGKHGVHLDGVIAVPDGVFSDLIVFLGIEQQSQALALVLYLDEVAPAELKLGGIGPQLVVGLAADELIHGDAQDLALDVPAGDVDGRHGGGNHHAAAHAPEGVAVQMLPDFLGVKGIHADDELGKILALAEGCLEAVAVGQASLAPAVDALVGIDLHGDEFAQIALHACDFHKDNSFLKSDGTDITG